MSEEIKDNNHSENNGGRLPFCTCGKCIVKRTRKDFFTSFPYNKNLSSTGRTQKNPRFL